MKRKARSFQICIRSLRLFARLRNGAADAPPKVNLVFEIKGKGKIAFTVIGV